MGLPNLHVQAEVYEKYRWWPSTRVRWWIVVEYDALNPVTVGPFTKYEYADLSRDILHGLLLQARSLS